MNRARPVQAALLFMLTACSAPHPLHGFVLSPPRTAAGFTLKDERGASFSLAAARGEAVALFFGFTHCTDVCPQTLALLGKARERAGLTPHQLRIVMITVDPQRDNGAAMTAFFGRIGVRATGLTGTRRTLQAVYRAYGVAVEPATKDITHTDAIFLIDPRGGLRELLDPQTPLKDIAADLRAVVE